MRIAALLLLCLLGAQEKEETRRVRVILETTSDWTRVELTGGSAAVLSSTVEAPEGTKVQVQGLGVNKPAYDETPVTVRAEVLVTGLTADAKVVITKGDVGSTRLRILGKEPVFDETNDRNIEGDGSNRVAFPLDAALLKKTAAPAE
ncbi:MAG: hypothetical protein ACYTAF_07370, partial [Planctomycetota bacterium]